MNNPLPPAEELVLIDRELVQLDARRHFLLSRRAWLLGAQAPRAWGAQARPPVPAQGAEASAPSAQNVLLVLGAVLLAVAALAFTLVSWGSLGIAGRSAVLGVVTAAALGAPVVLLRRGLRSTAEAVAAVGLLLTVLDAYALYAVGMPEVDGTAYAAAAAAVLAAVWAGYGRSLPALRIPVPAALLTAQLPLPLAAAAGSAGRDMGWALLGTAALDAGLVLLRPGRWSRWAGAAGAVTGGAALLTGLAESAAAQSAGAALAPSARLAAVAALALVVAWRASGPRTAFAAAGGVAAVAAVAGPFRPELSPSWAAVVYLAVALPLLGALRVPALPEPVRRGLALAGAGVAVLQAVVSLAWVATVLVGRLRVLEEVWSVTTPAPAAADGPGLAPVVGLLLTAGAAWWLVRVLPGRPEPGAAAVVLAWAALFTAPVVLGGAPGPVFAAQLAVTLATGLLALRSTARPSAADAPAKAAQAPAGTAPVGDGGPAGSGSAQGGGIGPADSGSAPGADGGPGGGIGPAGSGSTAATGRGLAGITGITGITGIAAGLCALVGALNVSVAALDGRLATFGVLGLLGAAGAAGAAYRPAPAWVRAGAAALAVGYAALLAVALGALLEWPVAWWAPPVLVVPAAVAALGPRLGSVRVPAEVAAAASGLLAPALAAGDAPVLALVLALAGVVCAGAAVRPERRSAAGWPAGVLFLAATWVRLAASEVTVPEAYTLPVTAAALAVGFLRRRRDPLAGSWTAYGPGLAATLLPSTLAVWGDPHWLRPLLLGTAALGVTLAGARGRLRAPLLLGGAALAAVALHELTPYVVQVVDALPRWLPPALAGVLLLAVGATYEKRLRDARRLREAIGRLR
ncbi:SCO7613 C-terminal domain-containing membrane protein [Streptomyces sp. NPDC051563]|uniref:SCO7613 C-terminal domain-containing membrane protein n=1 Tax=Streptomyces sp. NPDC051563 TaxID=3365659 RepID=UPI0037B064E5